jgi:DNA polymerase III epsilon subunit-like protein
MNYDFEEMQDNLIANRFRGFLPVIIDVETGGFDANKHALLEIAAVPIIRDQRGTLSPGATIASHVRWNSMASTRFIRFAWRRMKPMHWKPFSSRCAPY